jgi:serine phosphatase RsbU (regulator of sigma subunit)
VAPATPKHLKLYTEPTPSTPAPASSFAALPAVLEAFRQATGWNLKYTAAPPDERPVTPGDRTRRELPVGQFDLAREPSTQSISRQKAQALASALAQLLGEAISLEHALWCREAELATAVPMVPAADEGRQLAEQLEAVLKGGAEALGCQAAGLYLLDDATSELKLRACWGLPRGRLAAPARPLRGAIADLEALLGSAVVLETETMVDTWRAPEPCAAAICVPISSGTTILGTLWIFSDQPRRFTDRQSNLAEIVAGRVAADLEREILLGQGIDAARWRSQLTAAEDLQREQLPSTSPIIDGWELAGWTESSSLGGSFFDWFCRPDDTTIVALGDAAGRGLPAALVAAGLKAALRSHAQHIASPEAILDQANQTLWTGSAGDQQAAALLAELRPGDNCVTLSTAGPVHSLILGSPAASSPDLSPRLGIAPEHHYPPHAVLVHPGQALILFSDGLASQIKPSEIAADLSPHLELSARELAQLVRTRLESASADAERDCTLVILKRPRP